MKKIDEKFLLDVFNRAVSHFNTMNVKYHHDLSNVDLYRYLVGAQLALQAVFCDDYDSVNLMFDFFDKKFDEYVGGKKSE